MSNTFTPLVTTPVSAGDRSTQTLKLLSQAEAKDLFKPLVVTGSPEQPGKACSPPSVTLQRQGEVVSGIRIECTCGQVIELSCVY
jgi:hypothetical protein